MKTVEIFDEDNSVMIDDQYNSTTIDIFPRDKKFTVRSSVKEDCFFSDHTVEYKLSTNPIELYMRTIEISHEPPKEYAVKDGVVLESEIIKGKEGYFLKEAKERVEHLKKEIEWSKIDLLGNCELNFFILSKHPEIISKEDYKKLLRQSSEKIKLGVLKIEETVKQDSKLQITTGEYGKSVWFTPGDSDKKESEEYWKLPKEKRDDSVFGKKLEYVEKFSESLFAENSSKYCGISKYEFQESDSILKHIDYLLDKKETRQAIEPAEKKSKTKGIIFSLLLTLFISWIVSWFVDINPFLIFVMVQVIAFAQSILGGWLGKFFE